MSWIPYQIDQKDGYFAYPPTHGGTPRTVSNPAGSSSSSSGSRISPAVLFVIVILAVLFFISGLLHLLVRFLKQPSSSASPRSSRYPEISSSDALQRQLQQLFHLHDSGLDQAFIDALPVFEYKEIVGVKEPFDCAVCLCKFSEKDKLRLLPMCSHAFHINCIDTWLLSNSTCPLCRATLYSPGLPVASPVFDFDHMMEDGDRPGDGRNNGYNPGQKNMEIEEILVEKGSLSVRLGKFRKVNDNESADSIGETSSSSLDARRCFSMGSYQYVLDQSDLRVLFCQDHCRNHDLKLAEEVQNNENLAIDGETEGKKICNMRKGESFSVSKIWLWSKNGEFSSSDNQTGMPYSLDVDLPWMQEHRKNET